MKAAYPGTTSEKIPFFTHDEAPLFNHLSGRDRTAVTHTHFSTIIADFPDVRKHTV